MKTLIFATANPAKIKSLEQAFSGHDVKIQGQDLAITEIRSDLVEEVANEKVKSAFSTVKQPVAAQDGGLFIDALKGFPGAYVNPVMKTIGIAGILALMNGKPITERVAQFVDVVGYLDETMEQPKLFKSIVRGRIAENVRGELTERNWGQPHLIFIPEGFDKTLAEMNDGELKIWQERFLADFCTRQFARWYLANKL